MTMICGAMATVIEPADIEQKNSDIYFYRPAIPISLALVSGICMGNWFPGGDVWALGFALCGLALILRRVRLAKPAEKAPLGLLFILGYFSLQPYVAPILPSHHVSNFDDGMTYTITGRIVSAPETLNGRRKMHLAAETLHKDRSKQPVSGYLRLTIYGDAEPLAAGDRIRFDGRIKKIRNFFNAGGFDYQRYMAFNGIRASTYCRSEGLHLVSRHPEGGLLWAMGQSRSEVAMMIADVASPGSDTHAILSALLIGRTEMISSVLRERFNQCGLGHLLAISGLHVGIVAMAAFYIFSQSLVFVPTLLWRGLGHRIAAALSFIPVIYYGWLAGFSPSTQRAVIMVAILLAAYLVGRKGDIYNTLAWAAVVILILHPPTLFTISFQLSFAAVMAIVIGVQCCGPVFAANHDTFLARCLYRLRQILLISIFALIGTLPFTMVYFNQVSFLGPLANLVIVPILGFIAIPLGLLAVFVNPLSAYPAMIFLNIAAAMVDISLDLIHLAASLPGIALRTVTPTNLEILLYFLFIAAVLGFQKKRLSFVATGVVILLVLIDALFWIHLRFYDPRFRVTALDVGQGSATLLELPRGKTILIDGGGFSDNAHFDVGARIVGPFLWRKKIRTLDLVVLTHPNSDHLNGLLFILENFKIGKILSNQETADTQAYRQFQDILLKKNLIHPDFDHLSRKHQINDVTIEILYPPVDFTLRKNHERWRNSNNNSLVLKVVYGNQSLLFPGDLMLPAENALLATYPAEKLHSDILFAPHHGSKSSSSWRFIKAVRPEITVISCGWENPFGFPDKEVISRYQEIGSHILRLDHCGAVQLVLVDSKININTVLPCINF